LGLTRRAVEQRRYDDPAWKILDLAGRPFPDEQLPFVRVRSTGQPVQGVEHAIAYPDGTRVMLAINAAPLRDARGGFNGMVAALEDITVRKQTEGELRASREQLRALAARLQAVREEERTRLAREIHDVLAQELTRLKIDLVWLRNRLAKPVPAAAAGSLAARVTEMSQMADTAIHAVQRIATELRPAVLDSLGLSAAVEWQVRDFQAHAKIPCHASVAEEEQPVGRATATAAFRILQESLTNVLRHAQATRVEVALRQEAGQCVLTVADNGRGIRPEVLTDPLSIGLAGMRERAGLLGGQLAIRSQPGAGTTIEVRLPLANGER
jgi:signal transduction histidine kinase